MSQAQTTSVAPSAWLRHRTGQLLSLYSLGRANDIERKFESMSTETEALEQFFAAINHNDMQAITKDFDPEIVPIEPEAFLPLGHTAVTRK